MQSGEKEKIIEDNTLMHTDAVGVPSVAVCLSAGRDVDHSIGVDILQGRLHAALQVAHGGTHLAGGG